MQLGHAAVIHNDIKTADGEFDIFMGITAADVQRVAQKYFTPENRLVLDDHAQGVRRQWRCAMRHAAVLVLARARAVGELARTGPELAVGASAAAAARPRGQVSALRVPHAAERAPGDRGLSSRTAGGQPAADHPRRWRAGSGRQARRRHHGGDAARPGNDDEKRRADRQRDRFDRRRAGRRVRIRSDLHQRRGDERQPGLRAAAGRRRRPQSGILTAGDRTAAAADDLRDEGELRRPGLHRWSGVRSARLRISPVWEA